MIIDRLENAARYTGLKKELSQGFGFLAQPGLAERADGRHEILGDQVFAMISHDAGRTVESAQLEAHRRYIDIQYIISGDESMGWAPASGLTPAVEYDEIKDLVFFEEAPQSIVRVPPGCFALFLPNDAHLPLIGEGPIHKVIVKVAVV